MKQIVIYNYIIIGCTSCNRNHRIEAGTYSVIECPECKDKGVKSASKKQKRTTAKKDK